MLQNSSSILAGTLYLALWHPRNVISKRSIFLCNHYCDHGIGQSFFGPVLQFWFIRSRDSFADQLQFLDLQKSKWRIKDDSTKNTDIITSTNTKFQILRLSTSSREKATKGMITNLISNDVARFPSALVYLHICWMTPIQFVLMGYAIWQKVQIAALAGLLLLVLQGTLIQGQTSL